MTQKKVVGKAKLQIIGGSANPAPPVGPTLSSLGVNIMQFCQSFNSATSNRKGEVVPVIITAYRDASFDFVTLEPPVSALIKEAVGLEKASSDPLRIKVGAITPESVKAIAERKLEELNTRDVDAAMNIVKGTARSMGVVVGDKNDEEIKELIKKGEEYAAMKAKEEEEAAAAADVSESDSGEDSTDSETQEDSGDGDS
tara:strand:- start:1540 stop:2136 length:597 start_codon:yes stop_codon:yes gene_type:complete